MFKKFLNVGKSSQSEKIHQEQLQQAQKSLFQLNEVKSYGFSGICCLGYSSSLSLLAVGTKQGLLRVLGNSAIEFSYQLDLDQAIKQIEFIDCRPDIQDDSSCKNISDTSLKGNNNNKNRKCNDKDEAKKDNLTSNSNDNVDDGNILTSAKILVLTDNGQIHLLHLKTTNQDINKPSSNVNKLTESNESPNKDKQIYEDINTEENLIKFTTLEYVAILDYFMYKQNKNLDRFKRVTTFAISACGLNIYVGTEKGNVHIVPLEKFVNVEEYRQLNSSPQQDLAEDSNKFAIRKHQNDFDADIKGNIVEFDEHDRVSLSDNGIQVDDENSMADLYDSIKFNEHVCQALPDEIRSKKQGAVESIKRQNGNSNNILISYHRGLSIIFDLASKKVVKYFYHNQLLESSCFTGESDEIFYTSHNDGSYIRWNAKNQSQIKVGEESIGQLFGPYPCKPITKIEAGKGLFNDKLEDIVVFSGGMPRAQYDDKNTVTIFRSDQNGKDTLITVLDFSSKILDFVIITKPKSYVQSSNQSNSTRHGGKKNKNKQKSQQQQYNRNLQVASALAVLAEEEFVVIDLLHPDYLEFPLPYLNCVHSSAIICNQHFSDISEKLYERLIQLSKSQLLGKYSLNDWPIQGGKVVAATDTKSYDILLTGHEDGSVNIWDVSRLSMRHLIHLKTISYFNNYEDDDFVTANDSSEIKLDGNNLINGNDQENSGYNTNEHNDSSETWPPLKKVGKFDPFSDDSRLAIKWLGFCPHEGTLAVAGTGGQTMVFELCNEPSTVELSSILDEQTIVDDDRFVWKGRSKLKTKPSAIKFDAGYKLVSLLQLNPPVSATALDLKSEWNLYAIGTSYGFVLYDYKNRHAVINKCTLNVQDFAIVCGDANSALSRKKSFRKSLRESFRRLRRGRSQRQSPGINLDDKSRVSQRPNFGRTLTGVRQYNVGPQNGGIAVFATERQVEQKIELSSIVKCLSLKSAMIGNNSIFTPTLWVGTNGGSVLLYSITLNQNKETNTSDTSEPEDRNVSTIIEVPQLTTARLVKEIQLKHKAPIVAIFVTPEDRPKEILNSTISHNSINRQCDVQSQSTTVDQISNDEAVTSSPSKSNSSSPSKTSPTKISDTIQMQQSRVLICSEEQFKVFNLPSFKAFCKFKLTANEGLRAKKINITHIPKPSKVQTQKLVSLSEEVDNAKTEESNNNITSTINNNLTTSHKDLSSLKDATNKAQVSLEKLNISKDISKLLSFDVNDNNLEPYMICMSNQGDCAIYSIPDLKRQAQIQVCQREDITGITSTILTDYGEGFYLKSSSDFMRFSISAQRVLRVLSVV